MCLNNRSLFISSFKLKKLYKLIYLLPVLAILVGVNYTVDPAHLFSHDTTVNVEDDYEKVMVKMLGDGYNVTNVENYNERLFQKYFVESLKEAPNVLVLGSSKSQLIGETFWGNGVINSSVTGATLEDILAIYSMYEEKKITPNKLVLELSPWVLNDNNNQSRWKKLEENYNDYVKMLGSEESQSSFSIPPKYLELISFEYFQQSMKLLFSESFEQQAKPFFFTSKEFEGEFNLDSLFYKVENQAYYANVSTKGGDKITFLNTLLKKPEFYNTWFEKHPDIPLMEEVEGLVEATAVSRKKKVGELADFEIDNIVKLNRKLLENTFWENCPIYAGPSLYKTPNRDNQFLTRVIDGTISYPEKYRSRKQKKVNYMAQKFASKNIFGIEQFKELSQEKIGLLKRFIARLKKSGVEVELLLVPYHPLVHEKISSDQNYHQVAEAEKLLKSFAQSESILLYGGYNPYECTIGDSAFYDGMHLKESFLKRLLKIK